MKKKHYFFRWLTLPIIGFISFINANAASVNIQGLTPMIEMDGLPVFIIHDSSINVSSSTGPFNYVIVDNIQLAHSEAYYWSSYLLNVSVYMDGSLHLLQLKQGDSDYGRCFIGNPSSIKGVNGIIDIDGVYYYIFGEMASVLGSSPDIEHADILSSITKDGISYPVTKIIDRAFEGKTKLTSITIPESILSIGNYAFSGTKLKTLVFNAQNCTYCGYLSSPAFPSSISKLTIGNDVTIIPPYFLGDGSQFEQLTIPNSVISIGYKAFQNSRNLESLTIPNSVTSIGERAFYNNSRLKSLTIGAGVISIGYQAFSGNVRKVFWMGNTPPKGYQNVSAYVNYVSNNQYSLNNQLLYQFLSSKFTVDGTTYIPVSPSERTCDVVDCVYSADNPDIVISDKVTNKGVELSVKSINRYSFYDNDYIHSLVISHNGNIDTQAFRDCSALQTVKLQNIGNIGYSAFYNSEKMSSAIIGDKVTGILPASFYGCSALTEITIPNTVTELGYSAFQNCSALTKINIGAGVPLLPENVFSGCSSLASLTIHNNISSVEDFAFAGCSSLSDITIEDAATKADGESISSSSTDYLTLGSNWSEPIFADCPLDEVYIGRKLKYQTTSSCGYSPFYRNTSLRTVEITDAETQIYDNEFYGCSNLTSLKIGNGVKTIGNWAFSGCSSLDYFSAGNQVESIGKEAFSDCTGLTKYYSYSTVPPVCGDQALDDINKWECTLYVPNESSDEYRAAPQWKDFFFIDEMEADSGINDVILDNDGVIKVFNLSGYKVSDSLDNLSPGIYIVKQGAKTYKISVK